MTRPDGTVRELSTTDMKMLRGPDTLPATLQCKLGVRGAQRAPNNERITIRLSRDGVVRFRATGDGWQGRVDTALKDGLRTHEPAAAPD